MQSANWNANEVESNEWLKFRMIIRSRRVRSFALCMMHLSQNSWRLGGDHEMSTIMIVDPQASSSDEEENNCKFKDEASARWCSFANQLRTAQKSRSRRLSARDSTGELNPAPNTAVEQEVSYVLCEDLIENSCHLPK